MGWGRDGVIRDGDVERDMGMGDEVGRGDGDMRGGKGEGIGMED